jgi:hypothetical protein
MAEKGATKNSNVFIQDVDYAWIPAKLIEQKGDKAVVEIPDFKDEQAIRPGAGAPKKTREKTVNLKDYQHKVLPLQNLDGNGNMSSYADMVQLPYLHEVSVQWCSARVRALCVRCVCELRLRTSTRCRGLDCDCDCDDVMPVRRVILDDCVCAIASIIIMILTSLLSFNPSSTRCHVYLALCRMHHRSPVILIRHHCILVGCHFVQPQGQTHQWQPLHSHR